MYKVGDEVLIKGEVIEVVNDVPYPVKVRLGSDNGGLVFTNDEVCYADKIVKTYEQGLADAWELAKKIYDMTCTDIEEILGVTGGFWGVIKAFTAEEALAKIEAYEKEKEIKEGMIVVFAEEKWIVAEIKDDMLRLWNGKEIREARKSSCEPTKGVVEVSNVLGR